MNHEEDYKKTLRKYAEDASNVVAIWINENVPASVPGMRYARQSVLETVIELLEKKV